MKEKPKSPVLLEIARMASCSSQFRSKLRTDPVAVLSNLGVDLSEGEAELLYSVGALTNGRLFESATEPDIPVLWSITSPITLAALHTS